MREKVWKTWTDPKEVMRWGPNGFTNAVHEMEVTPGGVWRIVNQLARHSFHQ
jgi:uncharacterized protein YndB with AHSA1/START domain